MSKRNTRISRSLSRSFASVLIVSGCLSLFADSSFAQEKGFSIFEPAKTSVEAPPVVAPKEAFTNPLAKLPKSQFGSFDSSNTTTVSSKPQLNGPKPGGNYAQDGRSMFRQPPVVQANRPSVNNPVSPPNSGKLQPFKPNSLRASDRPQPDSVVNTQSKPAPIVVGDFQQTARPLSPVSSNPAANAQSTQPKVAQVAFQDGGGFAPTKRGQGESSASRFNQSTANRFGQSPSSTPNRFAGGAAKSGPASTSQPTRQPGGLQSNSNRSTLGRTGTQPLQQRQPNRSFPQRSQQQTAPPVRNDLSSLRTQKNVRTPQNVRTQPSRTAALPQSGQPNNRRANPVAPTTNKTGTQAAKEMLSQWAEANPELELPGKQMKLHEFLAQPINGSRRDAINQYWMTFADMANHKLAIEQSQWLSSIAQPRQQTDQAVLKAAQQDAQNRVLHTEIQLAKSQSILGDFLPNLRYKNGKRIPVLPSDTPWVGKLNTKFEEYQKRGIVPARFNTIDDILPKARQLIANRADAVSAASRAAQQARTALKNGQSPVANVLEAVRMKAKNQQDFLSNVTGYNRAITDYVLSVRQDINQPKRLASVLIGRKSVQSSVARKQTPEEDVDSILNESNPTVRQVSAGKRAQQNQSQGLTGKSAYQNQNSGSDLQASSNSLKPIRAGQPAVRSKSSFAYGPSKESAEAANFDPAKIKEEMPMQQAKAKGTSPGYNGSVAGNGGNRAGRTAQNLGGRRSFDSSTGQRAQGGQARTQQPPQRGFTPPAKSGGFSSQQPAAPQVRPSGIFSPGSTGPAGQAPSIPSTSTNPFNQIKTPADPSAATSATNPGGINRSFGGSGFQGSGVPKPSTASRFGGNGSSGFGDTKQR